MLKIYTLPLGSYQTNCYIIHEETAQTCCVIDPGYTPEIVLDKVEELGLTVEAVLLTHGHFDHVGGVKQIAAETGCKVYICAEELKQPLRYSDGLHYTDTVAEGDVLALAGLTLQVLHTPGHTPGCVCYLCGDTLFSGDTLFAGTCGRTDLPGGDFKAIQASLQRLAALEGDLKVLPGHGMASSLDIERRYNPYMQERIW